MISRPSQLICVASQRPCAGGLRPSHAICVGNGHESRVGPHIIARRYSYDELVARDKTSLDVFWLKNKSLTDLDNLPEPDELAEEIIENLEAGLESFRQVLASLQKKEKAT